MSAEDESLPALVAHDMDAHVAARIRRRAQATLASERALIGRPLAARASRIYSRAIEPGLVVVACVVYLSWAIQTTLALMP